MSTMIRRGEWGASGRQRGAVLLLVTFSLIVFFGLAALALDIGRMYIVKSQLQNAADAGALRAAKELDGTSAGVTKAETEGVNGALKNKFLLTADEDTSQLVNNGQDIVVKVGQTPDGPFVVTPSDPSTYYFAQVTTKKDDIRSFFAGILGIDSNAALAVAVAGRYHIDITPLAMCAIDVSQCPPNGNCGYDVGFGYRSSDVNPIGPGTPLDIDPMGSSSCGYSSASQFNPFVCAGKSSISGLTGSTVYTNTGTSTTKDLLDSRFGVNYGHGAGNCPDPSVAPPDTNVMQYFCSSSGSDCTFTANDPLGGKLAANWMTPQTSIVADTGQAYRETVKFPRSTPPNEGIVWSSVAPGASPTYGRGTRPGYYPASGSPYDVPNSPGSPGKCGTASDAPYCSINPADLGISYTPKAHRRVVNMVIVDCQAAGGSCRPVTVLAVGEFFLMRKSDLPTDKNVYVEFRRIIPINQFTTEFRLYR